MAVVEEVHLHDIGTAFRITLYDGANIVDITTATLMELHFKKPDTSETVVTKTAEHYTDGSDGILQYLTVDEDDLDVAGPWRVQAKVTLPASGTWSSNIESFQVYENLLVI